jgi:signal transduction histidine kinase
VSDGGAGFDPATVLRDENLAHGLSYIRQRLQMFGCRLEVESGAKRGTRVSMDCPMGALGAPS